MSDLKLWKIFEENIVNHSNFMGITAVRIPDGRRMVNDYRNPGKLKTIMFKTPFDFAISIDGIAAFLDAKTEESANRFNYKSRLLNPKKVHQWDALVQADYRGSIAGLLVWFPTVSLIGWANVPTISKSIERHETHIGVETEGVVWQKDTVPIDLRTLMAKDLEKCKRKFAPAPNVSGQT